MNKKSFLLAVFTVLIWGSSFSAIRVSLHGGYTSGHLVLMRFLVASSVFVLYALWPTTRLRLPKREDAFKIMLLGFVGISIYHLGITFGEQTVSAGTTSMFVGSAPIFTSLISVVFLKERLSKTGWIGLLVGFIGITLITVGSTDSSFTLTGGAVLILIAAIATSFFFVFQKPFLLIYKPVELTAYVTWAGTIPFFIFSPDFFDTVRHASTAANMSAIYVGIFPAAIAYVTWATALSLGKASSVSSVMYAEPVVAIVVAWFVLNELPSKLSVLGGFIAISSVIVVSLLEKRNISKKIKID